MSRASGAGGTTSNRPSAPSNAVGVPTSGSSTIARSSPSRNDAFQAQSPTSSGEKRTFQRCPFPELQASPSKKPGTRNSAPEGEVNVTVRRKSRNGLGASLASSPWGPWKLSS